ncbi:MAG: GTPase ObgE [Treponemataceae bacterium]|nr:GTPase ObgE [Treponemataceae bacterium]
MIQFADEATIEVSSGKGGNGCIAFRREKYIPNGGPNGGDGGRGGDVIFTVKHNLRTLSHLRYKQHFKARNGGDGSGNNRFGKDGEDVIIPLPPGTTVRDAETGELLFEFTTEAENESVTLLTGGKGGWGNMHFKSSTNQAPRYAHDGKPGETRTLRVELSIMADIGLVGFPNAGKSSLLDYFTNARPKIAPYPFTTKIPNLGVLRVDDQQDIIIADIPGIIEGASDGAGLGIRFLKHISRTQGLIYIVDASDPNALTAFDTLQKELENFSEELAQKPKILLVNKIDVDDAAAVAAEIAAKYKDVKVIPMSVLTREGLPRVKDEIIALAAQTGSTAAAAEPAGPAYAGSGNIADGSNGTGRPIVAKTKSSFMAERAYCSDDDTQYPGSQVSDGAGLENL